MAPSEVTPSTTTLERMAVDPNRPSRFNSHLVFETGIIDAATAINARTDPATSEALEILGVAVNGSQTTTGTTVPQMTAATLTHERAFTVGAEYSANWLGAADGVGRFVEIGGVVKGHFDSFISDEKFTEKNGVTFVKLDRAGGEANGYFRGEAGFRLRVTQAHEDNSAPAELERETEGTASYIVRKDNLDDLLLFEALYQRNSTLSGLPDLGGNPMNRYDMRFMALPEIPGMGNAMASKHTKFMIGIEVSNDLRNNGPKDVQIFYGVNLSLDRLF